MRLIGISGLAGSGKDEVARILVEERKFCRVALADPLKRACAEWFGWSEERLWGPSALRNLPDINWDGLTARLALQTLGSEWGRGMHPDVWVRKALHVYRELSRDTAFGHYTGPGGLMYSLNWSQPIAGVVIPDVRYPNELKAIRSEGGKVWRVVRPGAGLSGEAGEHISERSVNDEDCDRLIDNSGTLVELKEKVLNALG